MGVGMGMAVIMAMRMVAMRMGVGMVVTMDVGRGWNHRRMLYYNITPVHGSGAAFRAHEASDAESQDCGLGSRECTS